MKHPNQAQNMIDKRESFFLKEYKVIRRNIALSAYVVMRAEKVNTAEIAGYMGEVNGQNFKANERKIYRLLKSKDFQVSDKLWRGYVRYIFSLLNESGLKKRSSITMNIDFTTDRDDF